MSTNLANLHCDFQKEFCPPVDSALVAAILSDHDVSLHGELQSVRDRLEVIKDAALGEEYSEFDPSGNSGSMIPRSGMSQVHSTTTALTDDAEDRTESHPDEAWKSNDTDLISLSHSLSSMGLEAVLVSEMEGDDLKEYAMSVEKLNIEKKEEVLKEMFPSVKPVTVRLALKKYRGEYWKTLNELLDVVFIQDGAGDDEEPINNKSVDAFADFNINSQRRKSGDKRNKAKTRTMKISDAVYASAPLVEAKATGSQWAKMSEDINFISSRTNISKGTISSLYHENRASLSDTISALLVKESDTSSPSATKVERIDENASEFSQEFPTIPLEQLKTLLRLTHPSTASAHEIAKALTKPSQPKGPLNSIELEFRFPPIEHALSNNPKTKVKIQNPKETQERLSYDAATALANTYDAARSSAFTQASAAYRKSKSDPLMGAAAAHYASLGRDYSALASIHNCMAAESLVEAQSTPTQLDLHGVHVKDAVRIAREKVTAWWVGLEESRMGNSGYRIVTGLGRHSKGGKAKLGPAVARMLIKEGWKLRIGEGWLVVTGVVPAK